MSVEETRKQITRVPEVMEWLQELGYTVDEVAALAANVGMKGPYDMGDYFMHYFPEKGIQVTVMLTDERQYTRHFDVLTLQESTT